MSSSNWIKIVVAAAIGITLGLIYGWKIQPVEYTNFTPSLLRADYRADYVLMIAEAYQGERNAEVAARRLAVVGSEPPAQIVSFALEFAHQNNFNQDEISNLQTLLSAMQTYQPAENSSP